MNKTIIIADDHSFTLQGTKLFLEQKGFSVVATCNNGITAFNLIKINQPQIAILDINMPGFDGLQVLQNINEQKIKTKVILLTMHKEKSVYNKAIELGASGYILKEQATIELEKCLNAILNYKVYHNLDLYQELTFDNNKTNAEINGLTISEKKVLELVSLQKSSQEIADMLFISRRTVEGHRRNIIEKLGLSKEKYSLVLWAMKNSSK